MRRLWALLKKESYQILRDPAVMLITFVLPPILLFLFAFAVSLDVKNVRVGVVLESDGPAAQDLAAAFAATPYLRVTPARHREQVERKLVSGELKAFAVIPADFEARLLEGQGRAAIQIITDASNPNTSTFTAAYMQGVLASWLQSRGGTAPEAAAINLEPRFWFNPELQSRRTLVPGAIAVVMTMIGTMLTALVVSREWERGTMEAMLATPATMGELILSKLLPYFVLGGIACAGCAFLAVQVLGVPMVGSFGALMLISAVFLVPALGQGLMISTLSKNQLVATQLAIMSGYLPSFLLSGFVFEIQSMPAFIQMITHIIPARYYVSSLQTVFLAGDIWPLFLRDMASMLAVGAVFFGITRLKSRRGLD
ncbi:MAG: ABC transporter permease [Halioglobus sp.]|nr:ABC transporter permease [Halioglobus sp.]